ncbi:MAG: hypothetical protein LBT89_00150 [Planctomycetaceae bacterium]|nr:hypothetical protein [Planctomycetaceae bacterium]
MLVDYTAWGIFLAVLSFWLLPLGIAAGLVCGMIRRIRPFDEARKIDTHYGFQDRILTATELARIPESQRSPFETLQLTDAAEHWQRVKAEEVAPLRFPKILAVAVIAAVLVRSIDWQKLYDTTPPAAVSSAEVAEVKKLLESLPDEIKPAVAERLAEKPQADIKDALAAVSKSQDDIRQELADKMLRMNLSAEALKELSEALSSVKELKPVSKAIQDGSYAKAAEALKKPNGETVKNMPADERKTAVKELQRAADKMEAQNQEPLQKALEQLGAGLKEKDTTEFKAGTETLAAELMKQEARQQAAQSASAALSKLAEAKNSAAQENAMQGNTMKGNADGGKQTAKTKEAGKNWGSGAAGDPAAGEKTDLSGKRQRENVTGQTGTAGDSEKEKPDAKNQKTENPQAQQARADYQNLFPSYRKAAEEALDTEPIPLGKRQMIRQYFTAIGTE